MAKSVKEIPQVAYYPWDQWLNGTPWRLVQGEDFDISLKGMACQCHNTAKRRKVTVQVRQRHEEVNGKEVAVLYVQAKTDTPAKKKKPKKKAKAK